MIPCLWSLLFGFDALTGVGWKGAPAAASFLVDIPRGLGNGIWRKRPYGLRLRIFPQPLGGALKNPNAAPTTPPCFGRWPRSSPLQTKGCSPLIIPKRMGSIQKIQVAALEDFLCCADFKSLTRRTVWQGCVFFLAKTVICKLFMNPIDKVGKQEYSFSSRTDRVLKRVKPVRQEVLETVKQLKNSRCFPFGSISAPGF